jgi:FkbM family methyltransferase
MYEKLNPRYEIEHDGVRMTFVTPSQLTRWRVESIYSKEPWTLESIASFQPDDLLLDCGANLGMYTVWAAATRQVRVIALEPEVQNYALLNRNIRENRLTDRVRAYCMGLSDVAGLSDLHMHDMRIGGSNHALGESLDCHLKPMQAQFAQGSIAYPLDDLVSSGAVPVPTHLKIDVDGLEHRVIAGARRTLRNPRLCSLLVETNAELSEHRTMIEQLNAMGFQHDPQQVSRASRQYGPFKGFAEYIFRRERVRLRRAKVSVSGKVARKGRRLAA